MNNESHSIVHILEHTIFHTKSNLTDFVSVKTNASHSSIIFLIDTEDSVSLIKIGSLSKNIQYDNTEIIKLIGIAKSPLFSLGSFKMKIIAQEFEFEHKFHIVADDFLIPSSGLIGKDFLKRFKCLVDYGEITLTIRQCSFVSVSQILSKIR